jgi:hypothetical protein
MRYGFFIEAKNDELLIFNMPTNYMKAISNIDSIKWIKDVKF